MIFAPFPLKKKEKDIKKQKLKKTFLWKNNTYRYNFQKCENRLKRQWFSNFPYKHRKKDLRKRTHCVVKLDKLQIWEYNHNGRVKCYTVFLCEKCIFYPWGKNTTLHPTAQRQVTLPTNAQIEPKTQTCTTGCVLCVWQKLAMVSVNDLKYQCTCYKKTSYHDRRYDQTEWWNHSGR